MMIFALVLVGLGGALAYPTGPPIEACGDMFPVGHNVTAQNTTAPFSITLSGNKYGSGSSITLTVQNTSALWFEGLFVQARDGDGSNTIPRGTFTAVPSENLKTLACNGTANSALSHSNKAHYASKTFVWTAPSSFNNNLKFRMTIVHETPEFWTEVMSAQIMYDSTLDVVPTTTAGPAGTAASIRLSVAVVVTALLSVFA